MTLSSRASLTPELLDAVRTEYGLVWDSEPRDCGGVNLNVHLPTMGDGHVVRVYAPWTSRQRLAAIQSVRASLVAAGLPFVLPLETVSGAGSFAFDDRFVEVEPFRPAENMTIEQLPTGVRTLARVHDALRAIDGGPYARKAPHPNHVDADRAQAWASEGAAAIRSDCQSDDELRTADAADELAAALRPLELELMADIPRQLVHGDFWDNNVLFRDSQVAVLLDLDFMGERPRIDDLALTMYYTNSTLRIEGWKESMRLACSSEIVDSYDAGLEHALSDAERAALPLALARTVLCFVGMVPLIDIAASRRRLIGDIGPDIAWSLDIVSNLERWREEFRRATSVN